MRRKGENIRWKALQEKADATSQRKLWGNIKKIILVLQFTLISTSCPIEWMRLKFETCNKNIFFLPSTSCCFLSNKSKSRRLENTFETSQILFLPNNIFYSQKIKFKFFVNKMFTQREQKLQLEKSKNLVHGYRSLAHSWIGRWPLLENSGQWSCKCAMASQTKLER